MANQSRLEILITANAESAKAEFAAIQGHLAALEKSHAVAAAAAEAHSKSIDMLTRGFERLKEAAAIIFSVEMFEKLIQDAVTFTTDIQKLSVALNGNVEAGSAWVAVAEKTGVQINMLARGFAAFSTEANNNSATLRDMGVATLDSSGHLRSMNEILRDSLDWFHRNAGATNEAAIAKTLFGRASADLLPILEQGTASLDLITEEARRYGLILNSETLQRQLAMNYQLKAGEEAVRGLAINLGMALLPAVAAAGQGLSNFVANHLQQLINGINQAVSYIIGIGEAFGLWDKSASDAAIHLGQVSAAAGNYGDAIGGATSGANANAAAQRAVTEAARDATTAIDAQIRVLTNQEKALTDAQNLANFETTQTKVKQQEADKQKDIEKLKHDAVAAGLIGNFVEQERINDQIQAAQREVAKFEVDLTKNSASEQMRVRIDALHSQRTILEDQKKAINDAAQEQISQMQAAANAGVEANRSAGLSIPPIFDAAGKDAADKFKFAMNTGAEDAGKAFGDKFKAYKWGDLGDTVGTAVVDGMEKFIKDKGVGIVEKALVDMVLNVNPFAIGNAVIAHVLGGGGGSTYHSGAVLSRTVGSLNFAGGGIVPGPVGTPQIATVHGGERVQTPAQQGMDDYRIVDRLDTLIAVLTSQPAQFSTSAYGR